MKILHSLASQRSISCPAPDSMLMGYKYIMQHMIKSNANKYNQWCQCIGSLYVP